MSEKMDEKYGNPMTEKKILLAEDDPQSLAYLNIVLKSEGYSVIIAKNGEDAVKISKETPDLALILMDIKMPKKSGLDATKEIRAFNADIPIIAQTAFALAGDKESIMNAGCNDYISKPFNRADIIEIVKKYVG
ncbi:response regulator [Marinilabilia sp.]|jgi:CheY-like chemotaxis protein